MSVLLLDQLMLPAKVPTHIQQPATSGLGMCPRKLRVFTVLYYQYSYHLSLALYVSSAPTSFISAVPLLLAHTPMIIINAIPNSAWISFHVPVCSVQLVFKFYSIFLNSDAHTWDPATSIKVCACVHLHVMMRSMPMHM